MGNTVAGVAKESQSYKPIGEAMSGNAALQEEFNRINSDPNLNAQQRAQQFGQVRMAGEAYQAQMLAAARKNSYVTLASLRTVSDAGREGLGDMGAPVAPTPESEAMAGVLAEMMSEPAAPSAGIMVDGLSDAAGVVDDQLSPEGFVADVILQGKNASEADVMAVQRILKDAGYDLGAYGESRDGIDGVVGKMTREAALNYLYDNSVAAPDPSPQVASTAIPETTPTVVAPVAEVNVNEDTFDVLQRIVDRDPSLTADEIKGAQQYMYDNGSNLGTTGEWGDGVDGVSGRLTRKKAQEHIERLQWNSLTERAQEVLSSPFLNRNARTSPADLDAIMNPPIGLEGVKQLSPMQVYSLRQAGDLNIQIGNKTYANTNVLRSHVGYAPGDIDNVTPAQAAANLDAIQLSMNAAIDDHNNVPLDLMNAIVIYESKGLPNAVSYSGALGMMQMTSHNYNNLKNPVLTPFNPMDPEQAIPAGVTLVSYYIEKYGTSSDGINKVVAAYNQGETAIDTAIENYGVNWAQHIKPEGQDYITNINAIRSGTYGFAVPGYFGNER